MTGWSEMSYRRFANQSMVDRIYSEEPEIWAKGWMNEAYPKKNIQNFKHQVQEVQMESNRALQESDST
jgi:prephenate dehydrogenase